LQIIARLCYFVFVRKVNDEISGKFYFGKGATIDKIQYCFGCGAKLIDKELEGRVRKFCPQCGSINYRNPIPSVAVVITDDQGRLLLTKRSVEPGKGLWCLPGGFMELGETPEDTIIRETREETGLKVIPQGIIDACAKIGGFHGDVLILGYRCEIAGGELQAGDDADAVAFFPLNELPAIAFRCHKYFIETVFGIKLPPASI
jgi:ADP-ribose pyrophosphatase YjhB (NUDIX family)